MTALLYISYSRELSEEDKLIIDKSVFENQKTVFLFVRNFASDAKNKTRERIVIVILGRALYFSNVQPSEAIGLSMAPAPMVRFEPNYQYDSNVQNGKVISIKKNLIVHKSPKEILFVMYLTDPRMSSNQEILKLVKELRGGSWELLATTAFLGLIILMFSLGEGFIPNNINPGWGLGRPAPFQPPTVEHTYPPIYDLLSPRRTCYADRPKSCTMMAEVNPQCSREELTQLSTDVVPTQTQISGFVKNGKVDLNQAFSEVNRRASAIDCETFDCSFDRFKELATECGEISDSSVREAITILQGEMHGYYKNARRVDYGPDVKGLDFAVDGIGQFVDVTHADAKNAVGSAIEIADGFDGNIWKQGKKIGKKSVWQKKYWSNITRTSQVPNINPDAYLPESVNSTLTVVDCYDVPNFEKQTMNSAINFGAKNDTNLIILNNHTNI